MNDNKTLLQAMQEMSESVYIFYAELVRLGMDDDKAMALTVEFIRTINNGGENE